MSDLVLLKRLLDSRWYGARHPDAASNPFEHFVSVGLQAGFDPNPLFDSAWYARRYPGALRTGQSAVEHYLASGADQDFDPGPFFDTQWYLTRNPDVAEARANAFVHYLEHGSHELRDPSPLFDSQWYFTKYPDARAPGLDACGHYIRHGYKLGYSPSEFFDAQWYREAYPEVAATGENPLLHYLLQDVAQGYNPGPYFDTQAHLADNPACAPSGKHPLVHFLLDEEGRRRASVRSEQASDFQPSNAAVQQIDALVERLSDIEADLQRMSVTTHLLSIQRPGQHDLLKCWRSLYLSLFTVPRLIVLVGSIDDSPRLAELATASDGLLIVETDRKVASTAEALPRGTQWRALAEFGLALDLEDCVNLVTALVNNLQPEAVLVWGSQAGWEMLARHGGALRHNVRLFATAEAMTEAVNKDPLKPYFRSAVPWLVALYSADMAAVAHVADLFGLPRGQRETFLRFGDWSQPGGFLAPCGARS